MKTRKMLFAAIAATTLGAAVPAFADVGIWVDAAPPAPRHELVPAPRHGYVWAPGYYDYRHGHYVWVEGHWERERRGMHYHPTHWVQRDGRWTMERGGWNHERYVENEHGMRDRDHDGVPNRYDDHPDNPNRH
jgi:hypothetical protein